MPPGSPIHRRPQRRDRGGRNGENEARMVVGLRETYQEAWEDLRVGMEKAWQELKGAVESAFQKLK